jgi:hypothetical protein
MSLSAKVFVCHDRQFARFMDERRVFDELSGAQSAE